ncbi:MAG: hypothetical protein ABI382_01115 [Nakamurella sp.]
MTRLAGFLRTYWTRGTPGRVTPRSVTVVMLQWWLLAFVFKLIGSSWDVSWHFHWLRDDFAPPHLINTLGTGIAIVLVLVHTFTGYGADKRSLRIMQTGTIIFVIAAPIDVINHRVNGLDITSWSPSHALLYSGTAIMLAGVVRNWYTSYPREGSFAWQYTAGITALAALLFENVFFPNYQQEYGILSIGAWFAGKPYGDSELMTFMAKQLGMAPSDLTVSHFALPIPAWVYPVWTVVLCVTVLIFMRILIGRMWVATAAVTLYVVYRMLIWPALFYTAFPPSSVPFWLIGVGLAVDLAFVVPMRPYVRAVVGAMIVTAGGYGSLLLQTVLERTPLDLAKMSVPETRAAYESGSALSTPPIDWSSAWWAALLLIAAWAGTTWFAGRTIGLSTPRPLPLAVTFAPEPSRNEHGVLVGFPATTEDPISDSALRTR